MHPKTFQLDKITQSKYQMESFAFLQKSDSLNATPIKSRRVRHRERKKAM